MEEKTKETQSTQSNDLEKQEEKAKTPPAIVYPWDLFKKRKNKNGEEIEETTFKGSTATRNIIIEKLLDHGYPELKELQKPTDTAKKTMDDLIVRIHDRIYSEPRVPFLMVLSNSPTLLQSLATYVPVTMALTHHLSVATTSNRDMVETFKLKKTDNPFDQDIGDEVIERYQRSWLLFWNDINLTAPHIYSYHSYFADILNHRIRYRNPTVFTSSYRTAKLTARAKAKSDATQAKPVPKGYDLELIYRSVEKYLGSTAVLSVEQYCDIVDYHVEDRKKSEERIVV